MQPLVCVITASHQPQEGFLLEAYRSLQAQTHQPWEWRIQLDGGADLAARTPEELRADTRMHVAVNGTPLGSGATRNLALVRTSAPFVANLDADDLYYPAALERLVQPMLEDPEVSFTFGENVNLWPDGTTTPSTTMAQSPYPLGRIEPGMIPTEWLTTSQHHTSCSHAMYRTSAVFSFGGWGALQRCQDLALLLPLTDVNAAYCVEDVVGAYRRHDGQVTNRYREAADLARRFIATRLLCSRSERGLEVEWEYVDRDGNTHKVPVPGEDISGRLAP